jgi:putative ABC transport system substrate-binding protein
LTHRGPAGPAAPRRTAVLVLALVLAAIPLVARAQTSGRVYRVGILHPNALERADRMAFSNRLPAALRELGYAEGQNLAIELRYADRHVGRLPELARELVQQRVDVILAVGTLALQAAREATAAIPIVMFGQVDPVTTGFVTSLGRPGGNVTGVRIVAEGTLAGKRLALLKEAVPQATRIGVLSLDDIAARVQIQEAQQAATALGVQLVPVDVRGGDYDQAFSALVGQRPGALFVLAHSFFANASSRKRIIELAAKHRLPAIYEWREHVEDGGLMAYGSNQWELIRRAATYIDRLLKGARPSDLPIEQATTFELVVNVRTARRLGLTLPSSVLGQADQVIDR